MPTLLPIRIAKVSYRGRRRNNQDSVWAVTFKSQIGNLRALLAVADGMGGMRSGEVASALAIETLKSSLDGTLPLNQTHVNLKKVYHLAHRAIFEEAQNSDSSIGMGTTLVTAAVIDNALIVANVGDSRAYLFENNELKQITVDHNLAAESQANFGGISIHQSNPLAQPLETNLYMDMSGCLSRSLGVQELPDEIDFFPPSTDSLNSVQEDNNQPSRISAQIAASGSAIEVRNGAVCLLCSDGLYKVLSDEDITEQLLRTSSLDGACENLARLAYYNGSDDNISLCAIEFGYLKRAEDKVKILPPIVPDLKGRTAATDKKIKIGLLEKILIGSLIVVFSILLAATILVILL